MLQMYNLPAILNFPTRLQGMLIIYFLIPQKFQIMYTVFPFLNGLSDHDAQLVTLKDLNLQLQDHYIYTARDINSYSNNEFKINLCYETWDCVFGFKNNTDVDTLFNSFLNNYLRIFHNHFPPT
jgi:hypothetical protein